jgi:hypothetical protein
MLKVIILVLAVLAATSSGSMAKSIQYGHQAAVALPEDPQVYAERIGRQTWAGRVLCDEGGYRIRPCDVGGGGK